MPKFLQFSLISTLMIVFSSVVSASDFPPDYTVKEECKTSGPVRICATNRIFGGFPRFTVEYKGGLFDSATEEVNVWIKFNGKKASFKMDRKWVYKDSIKQYAYSFVGIGSARNVHQCADRDSNTGLSPSPRYALCPDAQSIPGGRIRWYAEQPSREEKDLLFYARDERGQGNAWDIEVAMFTSATSWDSQNGLNYRFRFD